MVIVQTERRLKTWLNEVMKFGLKAIMYYGRRRTSAHVTISIYNSVIR